MKLIPLSRGLYAKVDDAWYEPLMLVGPWYAVSKRVGGSFYARNAAGDCMHNIVKRANPGETIDHINLDTLDNQEYNLRSATPSQQVTNRSTRIDNKTSGIPGVSWDKTAKTWRVYTNKNGKRICLGLRKDLDDAIALRNKSCVEIHGEYTRIFERNGDSLTPQRNEVSLTSNLNSLEIKTLNQELPSSGKSVEEQIKDKQMNTEN